MNRQLNLQLSPKSQNEIFDDLSRYIQIFKKSLFQSQQLAISMYRGNEYSYLNENINESCEEISKIIQQYSTESQILLIEQMTLQRFKSRLIETITIYKIKYQKLTNNHFLGLFHALVHQMFIIIKRYQNQLYFTKLMKNTVLSLHKFQQICIGNTNTFSRTKLIVEQSTKKQQENDELFRQYRNKTEFKIKSHSKQNVSIQMQTEELSKKNSKNKILNTLNQSMNQMQKRFDCLRCLDIQFSSFKNTYFQAKNNAEEFYENILNKNIVNSKMITTFLDDFQLHQKKKSKKRRKNQQLQQDKKNDRKSSIQVLIKSNKKNIPKQILRIKKNVNRVPNQTKFVSENIIDFSQTYKYQQKGQENQGTKSLYKANNVYIMIGKNNLHKPIRSLLAKTPQNSIKKTFELAMSKQKQQTQVIHKTRLNNNNLDDRDYTLRLKTQMQKNMLNEELRQRNNFSNDVKYYQKDSSKLKSPKNVFKKQNSSNYLQINNTRTVQGFYIRDHGNYMSAKPKSHIITSNDFAQIKFNNNKNQQN